VISFNGGGVVLSSKAGDQSFTIPTFTGNGLLQARKLASGVAGTPAIPIVITLNGNLNVAAGATLTLGTADNYIENISGTATGSGTVAISGGTVNSNTNTALQGLRVGFNGVGANAVLNLKTNAPTVAAIESVTGATANVVIGDGVSAATLNVDGAATGKIHRHVERLRHRQLQRRQEWHRHAEFPGDFASHGLHREQRHPRTQRRRSRQRGRPADDRRRRPAICAAGFAAPDLRLRSARGLQWRP
jgi:hypothetical protein